MGERYSASANIQYLNARYYDPELGLDLLWFDAAPLIAFTATKETDYALHGRVMRSMIPRVGLKRTDEFRRDVVRIALTSGLKHQQARPLRLPLLAELQP